MTSAGECRDCGHPSGPRPAEPCPKCGAPPARQRGGGLLEVDIAHHGETLVIAREKLLRAIDETLFHGHAGLKVIHGVGRHSGHQTIASLARALLRAHAQQQGGRLASDRGNPGATILWLNR